ncbi:MAG: hypothetical protein ACFFDS_01885 [Candidatus Thorarchaeota archaeon]
MFMLLKLLKDLKLNRKRGSPILEEILLIGIAVFIFTIIFGMIFGFIDWTQVSIDDIFGR